MKSQEKARGSLASPSFAFDVIASSLRLLRLHRAWYSIELAGLYFSTLSHIADRLSFLKLFPFIQYSGVQRNKIRLRKLLRHKRSGRLLDVGCGNCGFLSMAQDHFDVEGIDKSEFSYQSPQLGLRRKIRVVDVEAADLINDKYDVITAFNVLEHLHDPRRTVGKIRRSLKPNGIFFGSVPNNTPILGELYSIVSSFFDGSHRSVFPPRLWSSIFKEAGFNNISLFGEFVFARYAIYCSKFDLCKPISLNLMFICEKVTTQACVHNKLYV